MRKHNWIALLGGLVSLAALGLAACQTDGTVSTVAALPPGVECGGPSATSRAVQSADPSIKFPTEPTEFCYPDRSRVVLYKPANATDERLPAVIVLSHCAGMERYHYDWMRTFTEDGYAVLGLDQYTARGIRNNCYPHAQISEATALRDVVAAYAHLQTLAFIDPTRIGVVGFSYGGLLAVQAVSESPAPTLLFGERAHFAAAVAFYPPLSFGRGKASRLPWRIRAPTLVLFGIGDAESPHTPEYVKQPAARENPIELIEYDGASHLFTIR